jgi:hypothetical protein
VIRTIDLCEFEVCSYLVHIVYDKNKNLLFPCQTLGTSEELVFQDLPDLSEHIYINDNEFSPMLSSDGFLLYARQTYFSFYLLDKVSCLSVKALVRCLSLRFSSYILIW